VNMSILNPESIQINELNELKRQYQIINKIRSELLANFLTFSVGK
jgi:hypothetical protein